MIQAIYDKLLKQLKSKNPGHDMLHVIESMPGTHLAVEYIKLAIAEDPNQSAEEYTLQVLQKQRSTLYSRRAVLSNKFHLATTKRERAEISIAIGSLQTEIIANRRKLEFYNETGKLPAVPDKLVLPASGERKRMKLASVRTSICRFNRLLRVEKDPVKIKDYEQKLTVLHDHATELSA